MTSVALQLQDDTERQAVALAREIAVGLHDIETILKLHSISAETYDKLKNTSFFHNLVQSELASWNGSLNTHERTKLKAAALIEEWLPEANRRIHDDKESLSAKTELAKLVARIADMGTNNVATHGGGGEKFSVTINLGADAKLQFEKVVTQKVIEGEIVESS